MAEAEAWVVIPRLDKDKTGCVLDMRPLVLCKDCKHCEYPQSEKEWCKKGHLHGKSESWFCADGERK